MSVLAKAYQSKESIYSVIKAYFIEVVRKVLDKNGMISTEQNGEGNLDFHAGIIDASAQFTSESDGFSYKKLLCMSYDLAVSMSYSKQDFIRFIYHDGGLETLDGRKKTNFLSYVRSKPEQLGIQYILTVIDTDLPQGFEFDDNEVILTLHDDGLNGKLFKMESW